LRFAAAPEKLEYKHFGMFKPYFCQFMAFLAAFCHVCLASPTLCFCRFAG